MKPHKLCNRIYSSFLFSLLVAFIFFLLPHPVSAQTTQSTSFLYDASGQRLAKIEEGGDHTYYISPGLEVVIKADGTKVWRKSYNLPGNTNVVREGSSTDANGIPYYIHPDHLGSTSLVTDSDGSVVAKQRYYPYGNTRSTTGDLHTNREYTGQISDMDPIGLYYYNARYYDPLTAKFTQADTINDQLNRYAYVGNNPINRIDPSGNQAATDESASWFEQFWNKFITAWGDTYTSVNTYNEIMVEHSLPVVASVQGATSVYGLATMAGFAYAGPPGAYMAIEAIDMGMCAVSLDPMCVAMAQLPGPNTRNLSNTAASLTDNVTIVRHYPRTPEAARSIRKYGLVAITGRETLINMETAAGRELDAYFYRRRNITPIDFWVPKNWLGVGKETLGGSQKLAGSAIYNPIPPSRAVKMKRLLYGLGNAPAEWDPFTGEPILTAAERMAKHETFFSWIPPENIIQYFRR